MFFAFLHRVTGKQEHSDSAMRFLELAHDRALTRSRLNLYGGLAGIALITELVTGEVLTGVEDLLLERWASPATVTEVRDVMHGSAGNALYSLCTRSDRRSELVALTSERLLKMAEDDPGRPLWWTSPARQTKTRQLEFPGGHGHLDLGVAHGVSGILPVLAMLANEPMLDADSRARFKGLARATFDQLRTYSRPSNPGRYPSCVNISGAHSDSRLAWCYGDAGVAATLHITATALGDPEVKDEAYATARAAAARTQDSSGVEDLSFCHGSAGLLHLFGRLYSTSADDLFRRAARSWADVLIQQLRETADLQQGFLLGAAGVGLSLLGASTTIEPKWDALTLCSRATPGVGLVI